MPPQNDMRSFRHGASVRPVVAPRSRRPANNDELASSTPTRIGSILHNMVITRFTVSSTRDMVRVGRTG